MRKTLLYYSQAIFKIKGIVKILSGNIFSAKSMHSFDANKVYPEGIKHQGKVHIETRLHNPGYK